MAFSPASFSLFHIKQWKSSLHLVFRVVLKVMRIQSHLFFQGLKNVHKNSPNNLDCKVFIFTNRRVHINQVTKILHCMDFKIIFFVGLLTEVLQLFSFTYALSFIPNTRIGAWDLATKKSPEVPTLWTSHLSQRD